MLKLLQEKYKGQRFNKANKRNTVFTRKRKKAWKSGNYTSQMFANIYLNLELDLNKKTQIFKSKQGVNFCGYKINEYRLK